MVGCPLIIVRELNADEKPLYSGSDKAIMLFRQEALTVLKREGS